MLLLRQQPLRCAGSSRRQRQGACGRDSERTPASGSSTHAAQSTTHHHTRQAAAAPDPIAPKRSSPTCSSAGSSASSPSTEPLPMQPEQQQQQQQEQGMDIPSMAQHIAQRLALAALQPASLTASFAARRPNPTPTRRQLDLNLDLLLTHYTPPQVAKLLQRLHPDLLSHDLPAWHLFFLGLQLPPTDFYTLLMYSPAALLSNTPYTAGRAILFLRSFGLSQEDILSRVIPCYPGLLGVPEAQLREAAEKLAGLGLLEHPEGTQRLVQQCPSYFLPDLQAHLLPILTRIQNSRNGKFTNSGSYWI